MEILGAITGVFLAVLNPQWFDRGPYEFVESHPTIQQCQIATAGTNDICTTEEGSPSLQFTKVERNPKTDGSKVWRQDESTPELDWVQCDNFAGCYYEPDQRLPENQRNRGLKYGMQSTVFWENNFGDKRRKQYVSR